MEDIFPVEVEEVWRLMPQNRQLQTPETMSLLDAPIPNNHERIIG